MKRLESTIKKHNNKSEKEIQHNLKSIWYLMHLGLQKQVLQREMEIFNRKWPYLMTGSKINSRCISSHYSKRTCEMPKESVQKGRRSFGNRPCKQKFSRDLIKMAGSKIEKQCIFSKPSELQMNSSKDAGGVCVLHFLGRKHALMHKSFFVQFFFDLIMIYIKI